MANPFTDPRVLAAALGLGGGLLEGIGQGKEGDANRQLSREELLARQYENEQNRNIQRTGQDLASTQMDPLAQQKSRQQNAIQAALVGGARNYEVQAPSDMQSYMPKVSGGLRIPEGGFGSDVMEMFSPASRANAEAGFFGANPRTAPQNMESLGYGASASGGANGVLQQNRSAMQSQDANSDRERQALMQALSQSQPQEQKKGGGFGGFLGGLLKVASPFASLIPGVGPLLGMGLAAGGSALGTKMQGGSTGEALLSGGMGALGSKFGPQGSPGGRTSLPSSWGTMQQAPLINLNGVRR